MQTKIYINKQVIDYRSRCRCRTNTNLDLDIPPHTCTHAYAASKKLPVRRLHTWHFSKQCSHCAAGMSRLRNWGTSLPPSAYIQQSSSLRLAPHDPFQCRGTGAWTRMCKRLKATGMHDPRPKPQALVYQSVCQYVPDEAELSNLGRAKPCLEETIMRRTGAVFIIRLVFGV